MNVQGLKKIIAGATLVASLAVGAGLFLPATVQAQNRGGWRWDPNDRWERDDRRSREWERRREIERQREWERERARNRNIYRNPNYGNYGSYGNSGNWGRYGGYSYADEQRGFSKGVEDGREDGGKRRSFDPNRHSS